MSTSLFRGLFVASFALSGLLSASVPALAHVAPCPYCNLTITQDTPQLDNETVLKFGRKRVEYKCVYCALAEAQSDYQGDLTILAPSEKKGEPIKITRTGTTWAASAPDAVFAAGKGGHRVCHIIYRAFTNEGAFETWAKAHPEQFDANAKPLSLAQMVAFAKEDK